MQTDNTTLGNVTITDHRVNAPLQTTKPKEEKPKEKTEKQKVDWEAGKEKAFNRMFPNSKEKGDDEKPGDKKGDKKPQKPETTGDKKTAKEPAGGGDGKTTEKSADSEQKPKLKPVAKKEEAAPPVDYEKLATSVATATAKALKEDKAKPEASTTDEVPEARKRDLPAIEHLEKTNPKYKGKVDEYKKFARAEADYVSQWEKDNPGAKFDPDSEEHSAFYDKNEPDIDPEDVTDARVELAAERKAQELTGKTNKEIESLRLERDIERAEREVPTLVGRNLALVGTSMGEDVAKAISTLKEGESLEAVDPAAHNTLMTVLPELNQQTTAAAHIFGTDGRAYNPSDPVHQAVAKSALEFEALLLAQGDEKLVQADGRKYAKLNEWANMTKEQRAKHWTINADLMALHLGNNAAKKAEEIYKTERENAERIAKAYGYVKTGETQTARTATAREVEEHNDDNGKPRSPSTSTRSVIQPGAKVDPKTAKDGGEVMLGRMFGR